MMRWPHTKHFSAVWWNPEYWRREDHESIETSLQIPKYIIPKKTPPITKGSNECPMGALALSFVWIWMNALGNRRWNLHIRHSSVFPKRLWDYSRHLTLRTSTICKKHGRSAKQWTGCGRLKYGATPRGTICPGKRGFDLVTRVTSVWSTCISVGMYSNMHM